MASYLIKLFHKFDSSYYPKGLRKRSLLLVFSKWGNQITHLKAAEQGPNNQKTTKRTCQWQCGDENDANVDTDDASAGDNDADDSDNDSSGDFDVDDS